METGQDAVADHVESRDGVEGCGVRVDHEKLQFLLKNFELKTRRLDSQESYCRGRSSPRLEVRV